MMDTIKKKLRPNAVKAIFQEELPECFKTGTEKMPLMLGIHKQLQAHYLNDPRFDPKLIEKGIGAYVSTPSYLIQLVTGTPRIDMHGNLADYVSPEDEAYAKARLQGLLEQALEKERSKTPPPAPKPKVKSKPKASKKVSKPKAEQSPPIKNIVVKLEDLKNSTSETPSKPPIDKDKEKKQKQDQYQKKLAARRAQLKK